MSEKGRKVRGEKKPAAGRKASKAREGSEKETRDRIGTIGIKGKSPTVIVLPTVRERRRGAETKRQRTAQLGGRDEGKQKP